MSHSITVSGAAYFEVLDHLGTEAARAGVPAPTRLVRVGKGFRAYFDNITDDEAAAILDRLSVGGDQRWINMLRSEGAVENRQEITAALACQRDAEKLRALLAV